MYYSVGGGFLIDESEGASVLAEDDTELPFPIRSGDELLRIGKQQNLSLSDIMMRNELVWRSESEVRDGLLHIWHVMQECVRTGCSRTTDHLPGSLRVLRRAPRMHATMTASSDSGDPLDRLD